MSETSYILSDRSLTLFHERQIHTANANHHRWAEILNCLKAEDYGKAVALLKPVHVIRQFVGRDYTSIEVTDHSVLYKGEPLSGPLVDRIFQLRDQGFTIDPLVKFCANLQHNPSYRSREQLYTFLEHNNMPITPDGCFMAYKRVNADFTDVHSGRFDNSPGSIVEMSRNAVDDDPTRTCSAGLHVCSREYLRSFPGEKLIACKVNPAHVVSVPTDYNFTKMRVWKYEVVEELPISLVSDGTSHWDVAVVYDTPPESDDGDMNYDGDWEDPDHYDYND